MSAWLDSYDFPPPSGHPVSLVHSRLFLRILKQDIFDDVTGFPESLLLEYMKSSFVVSWSTLGRSMMDFYLYLLFSSISFSCDFF